MTTYELREIKHRHLILPAHYWPQLRVYIDHASVLGILQTVLFNIVPEAFGDLGAWQGCLANNGSQFRARL